jgi:hypothetical protein
MCRCMKNKPYQLFYDACRKGIYKYERWLISNIKWMMTLNINSEWVDKSILTCITAIKISILNNPFKHITLLNSHPSINSNVLSMSHK